MQDVKQFLSPEDVGKMLSLGDDLWSFWRIVKNDNEFPKPFRLSPRIYRWNRDEVLDWLERRRVKEERDANHSGTKSP